jgi:hypothetical protein
VIHQPADGRLRTVGGFKRHLEQFRSAPRT